MKSIICFIFIFLSFESFAQMSSIKYGGYHPGQNEENISFGPVYKGQYRMDLNLDDFQIVAKSAKFKIKTSLQENSLQWVRTFDNILMPRAIIDITIEGANSPLQLKYNGTNVALATGEKKSQSSKFFMSLLSHEKVLILENGKEVGQIYLSVSLSEKNQERFLRDYSCSRYGVTITGLEEEFVTVGCNFTGVGGLHFNKPHLQVGFNASNIKLPDGSRGPVFAQINQSGTVETQVIDGKGKQRVVKINARVPKGAPKLGMAWGAGPYALKAADNGTSNGDVIAPALFLYGKYDLEGGASIKFFDAFTYNKAFFNNFGLYFSYLLADAQDGRLQIMPLLGAQTLNFQLTGDSRKLRKVIYPQGFEFLLQHGLGIEGNTMALGLFIFPSETESYYNTWFRFGKGMFWEINYIGYKGDGRNVSTWGLSFGLPLATFL